ncbi:hypothetical protein JTB14_033146 [Gonioctena quinquepunctata]|nr:hypothetical protein JTB14_033146 [Gonioctena quinquepunctata]
MPAAKQRHINESNLDVCRIGGSYSTLVQDRTFDTRTMDVPYSYSIYLLLTILCFILLIYIYFSYCFNYWKDRGFPFLKPKFPLGNNNTLLCEFPGSNLENFYQYKEIRRRGLSFAGAFSITRPFLVVVDPQIAKDILIKDFDYFWDRGFYHTTNDPISMHIFSMNGLEWKNTRTHLNSTFSSGKLRMLFPLVLKMSELVVKDIEQHVKINENIDIKEIATKYSINTTATCAFGLECDNSGTFAEMTKKHFGVDNFIHQVKMSLINRYPGLSEKLGLKLVKKQVSDFFNDVLNENVKFREENDSVRPDFLQLLINLKNETKHASRPFTMNQLVAESFDFFLASLDTSSNTVAFALFELARNHDIQEKARKEISEVMEQHGDNLSPDCLAEMKYLRQIINETLRLYPPLPNLDRRCVKDYKINGTDLTIENGTFITIPIIGIHRDPGYYPDPEKFDPERFNDGNKKDISYEIFLPFGNGPRNCIGRQFGLMQVQLALIMILKDFKITISNKTQLPLQMEQLTMMITLSNPILLRAERIQE